MKFATIDGSTGGHVAVLVAEDGAMNDSGQFTA